MAKMILADEIDILIDLNGVSQTNIIDILVNRLAPVQMTWIGFPLTVPIKNMDYSIADDITDPAGMAEVYYTEKLMYLPKSFLCYGVREAADILPPPFLKNGYITFGSFNNSKKYSNAILKIWGGLFEVLTDARLIIRTKGADNPYTKERLIKKFEDNGIDVGRVSFLPPVSKGEYYAQYNEVDIVLDTYPFAGATTTCDAFLMATPIVSLYGLRHVTRVGLSMLTNAELSDLAVSTGDEYIKKAAELARDTDRLVDLNRNLRERVKVSPLFDIEGFKRDFEDAVYGVYVEHWGG
jgi:predicted O-linked N-acetylglucosamine transferase (SPINDLY family)